MGDRLRELLELGERVCAVGSILEQMLEAVGKLKGQAPLKKGRSKANRKA
jgi:hypothetical protein